MIYNLYYERQKRKLWAKWNIQNARYYNAQRQPKRMATVAELELLSFISKAG